MVKVSIFVDASHGSNKADRRSQNEILKFLNQAHMLWYNKIQPSAETSTFGTELCAMKLGVEMIEGLHYKLRMFDAPLDSPANV